MEKPSPKRKSAGSEKRVRPARRRKPSNVPSHVEEEDVDDQQTEEVDSRDQEHEQPQKIVLKPHLTKKKKATPIEEIDDEGKEEEEEKIQKKSDDYRLTATSFDSLPLSPATKMGLKEANYVQMTEIQSKAIPPLLEGIDLLGKAKTGSGKTLSFLVPAIERLVKEDFTFADGTGVIVLTPTRELAIQIFGVLTEILKYHTLTYGLIIGGANRGVEAKNLGKGVNIIVATPGRLLDHLLNTKNFQFGKLQCLILDETDRILDIGFEEDLKRIIRVIPKERQTMLFSATQTEKIADLARLSLRKELVTVGIDEVRDSATVANLEQGYVICSSELRFLLLFTFLKKNKNKKIIVFFSTCNSVKFHADLLGFVDIPVLELHGKLKQTKRTETFFEFVSAKEGILLCTDVAARGLDIPAVDWIIQFDPADDPKEYIHRVGRTARAGSSGKALLFLLPEEIKFLQYLRAANVRLNEYEFPPSKIINVQAQLEKLLEKNYHLYRASRDAYRSYLLAYASHSHKDIFNVNMLDLLKVVKAFGFTVPPKVQLNMDAVPKTGQKKLNFKHKMVSDVKGKNRTNRFSEDNPYGK